MVKKIRNNSMMGEPPPSPPAGNKRSCASKVIEQLGRGNTLTSRPIADGSRMRRSSRSPAKRTRPREAIALDEQIVLARWHLDRYDRLRVSTASRASVVLSAGAILSAGNAVILTQIPRTADLPFQIITGALAITTALSSLLVVMALLRASTVLVTLRDSKTMFLGREAVPSGLTFNGTETVAKVASFAEFHDLMDMQDERDVLAAAHLELWICINQHRHRYFRLRGAVRLLRYAAVIFSIALLGTITLRLVFSA